MTVPMFALKLSGVGKTFTMHLQGGIRLPVLRDVTFAAEPGQCIVLAGPSGTGKSSILKLIYGAYRCEAGEILVRHGENLVDVATAEPRRILALRRGVIGYVSQFLRVVPRVPTLAVVAESLERVPARREPARDSVRLEANGASPASTATQFDPGGALLDPAYARAAELLCRLNIPEWLWTLPPATFSGGEQQRVNIARGFLPDLPVLLLDEPTASLDAANRAVVVDLIAEKKQQGAAIIAIVHDEDVRDAIADQVIDVGRFAPTN